jgi:hypothetical protein
LLSSIVFSDDSNGYIAGGGMTIGGTVLSPFIVMGISYKTTDGGDTWMQVETGTGNGLLALACSDAGKWYAVGAGGTILNQGGGIVSVEEPSPSGTVFDIYPNPTNGKITITSKNGSNEPVVITFLDAKGAIVLSKSFDAKGPADLDLGRFAKGVYTVLLKSRTVLETRSVVVR